MGAGGDDGGFFDSHGHNDFFAVDDEVQRHPQGQAQDADDIFDHAVGHGELQAALNVKSARAVHVEPEQRPTLRHGMLVKARETGTRQPDGGRSIGGRWGGRHFSPTLPY